MKPPNTYMVLKGGEKKESSLLKVSIYKCTYAFYNLQIKCPQRSINSGCDVSKLWYIHTMKMAVGRCKKE